MPKYWSNWNVFLAVYKAGIINSMNFSGVIIEIFMWKLFQLKFFKYKQHNMNGISSIVGTRVTCSSDGHVPSLTVSPSWLRRLLWNNTDCWTVYITEDRMCVVLQLSHYILIRARQFRRWLLCNNTDYYYVMWASPSECTERDLTNNRPGGLSPCKLFYSLNINDTFCW